MSKRIERDVNKNLLDMSDDWISAITTLIKLTQTKELSWQSISPSDLMLEDSKVKYGNFFVAEYGELTFYLADMRKERERFNTYSNWLPIFKEYKEFKDYKSIPWIALSVRDNQKGSVQFFPQSRALVDLLQSVQSQISDAREVLDRFNVTTHRIGQASFRRLILEAYGNRCCITGEATLDVLEVVHILPRMKDVSLDFKNCVVLRADLHRLFDRGLISISPDYIVMVSSKVESRTYTEYQHRSISLPRDESMYPSHQALMSHYRNLFQP